MAIISLKLGTSTETVGSEFVTSGSWRPNDSFVAQSAERNDTLKEQFTNISDIFERNNSLSDLTSQSVKHLQEITTKLFNFDKSANINTTKEVTFYPDEVTSQIVIGTAEKVIIGAGVIVLVLAVVGIILRMLGPYCRSRDSEVIEDPEDIGTIETLPVKLSVSSGLDCLASSDSSGIGSAQSQDCSNSTGSTPISDWSSISSDINKSAENQSTSEISDQSMSGKDKTNKKTKENLLSVPRVYNGRMSSVSSPSLHHKLSCDQPPYERSHSLEPARFSDSYRGRWDEQWDPLGYAPPGRYPTNTKTHQTAKKGKHVRLSPPCDRKSSDR
ncbi:uncharacterized protein LOC128222492 isoform X2 [Mya arenaria]|uniref:uncharacterized protein LOC128222492 isoform X2 n=1 Tax=Mya arenaria TaxID=6604 RepID=UPI0022E3C132|nr:uncharacterized protein LOC128222492 isoform X2 [Mya arenaria]